MSKTILREKVSNKKLVLIGIVVLGILMSAVALFIPSRYGLETMIYFPQWHGVLYVYALLDKIGLPLHPLTLFIILSLPISIVLCYFLFSIFKRLRRVEQSQPAFAIAGLVIIVAAIWSVSGLLFMVSGVEALTRAPKRRGVCPSNVRQMALSLFMYASEHEGKFPTGKTSGQVFRTLIDKGYLDKWILSCPSNPVEEINFHIPAGVSYWIDPNIPSEYHELRAILADRAPWELNHDGEGVNVLFADGHVRFVRPEDSGPPDKISNPYIEEDTDIYANTGDPYKHAWIRWRKDP